MHNYLLRNLCLILTVWVISQSLYAIDITGRIASATDDTPLAGATVKLLSLPDSTFLCGTYADDKGNFTLSSTRTNKIEKVCVEATFIGYQKTHKVITLRKKERRYDLKDVYMQENAHTLGEAIVSATPPPMIIREDTIEYFADSYKTQPDASVEDLMKRLPGVEINTDGSITAQGETVQQVYVDGKEFFGSNVQATTKNLTAEMVETVQIVDMQNEESRLTGIDDGERRKVINLKLKPKMRRGWFGNAAAAWGDGRNIDDRFETKGMLGYFYGNYQNALVLNANNTNNTGFGDLGDNVLGGSSMRGNRNSGARGNGLNTSWSVGLNVNYDEGNRMRNPNTPFAIGGDVLYGGSSQDEMSRTHRINYLSSGNTVSDSYNTGDNRSQNLQFNMKFERTWGDDNQHRIQIRPSLAFNETRTDDYNENQTYYEDSLLWIDGAYGNRYISQTERSSNIKQKGLNYGLNATYSYTKQIERGRRRSSVTISMNGHLNNGDQYTRSFTSYDSLLVDDLSLHNDTTINQWQEEEGTNQSYRIRVTHVEPLAERHFLQLSASVNFSQRDNTQLYHFWDQQKQQYTDSVNGRSNLDYSSDTRSTNVNYTASVSYRTVQENYNMNVGMDFLPQTQEFVDDYDHSRDYKRSYVNYSPRLEYRYNWSRQQHLRITLRGNTQQPSASQLQARKNQTSATHVSLGNKDLDPSFSSQFTARYRTFNTETYRTIEVNLSANASFNTLSTKRWYSENLRTDTTMTVNLDGIGSWNVRGGFQGSFPFYDNLWYITTNTDVRYSETKGYANIRSTDSQLNHSRTTSGSQRAGIAYRGEKLTVELNGNYNIQHTAASIVTNNNLGTTHQFGVRGYINCELPWQFRLSSDINYTARRGYSAGITRNQTIWNAQLSRTFTAKRNISAFIKVYDILRERSNISRSVSATALTDRETTTLGQYFLIGASIKFNRMGQRGSQRGGRQNRSFDPESPTPNSDDNGESRSSGRGYNERGRSVRGGGGFGNGGERGR